MLPPKQWWTFFGAVVILAAVSQPASLTIARPANAFNADRDEWLTPTRFSLLLAALIFAAFPQVLLGWETFVVRDYGFFSFPVACYQRECFWRGELPLWNPYNECGVPFLAQWNTMCLYPPALIYLLLPLTWSLSFFCLCHLFWGGLGMYFLAHRWSSNRLGAGVAGVIFAFNGLSLNHLMWPSHIATFSWMPWVVLLVEQGWEEGGRKLLTGVAVGALQMLAGGPETILFTWLILSTIWLLQLASSCCSKRNPPANTEAASGAGSNNRPLLWLWRFPAIVCLVMGLTAAQLLPFLDLAAHSQRETGFADTRWSMPGWGWANFLVPMVFGATWKQGLFFQYGQFWTSSYYLGIGALLLIGMAGFRARGPRIWLLLAIGAIGFLLAGGDGNAISRFARRVLPQLSLITYPVKFVIPVMFAGPLLAGFAAARCRSERMRTEPDFRSAVLVTSTTLLLLIGAILFWAWRWPFPLDDFRATLRNGLTRAGLLICAAGILLAMARVSRLAWYRILSVALLVVFWLDVCTHEPPQNPTVPTWIYQSGLAGKELGMHPQPSLGSSRAMGSSAAEAKFFQLALSDPKDNFIAKRLGFFADCNLLDAVPKVNGFFSLYPRESGDLITFLYQPTNLCSTALMDFMGVSQVMTPGEYTKWTAREGFLPMITAGQRPVFMNEDDAVSWVLGPEFDSRRYVALPLEAKPLVSVTNSRSARVISQRATADRLEAEIEATNASMVVVSQTFYHQWKAYVDGVATPLWRANYAFQALEVPAGRHLVNLVYEDRLFSLGKLISGLSLLGVCGLWVIGGRKPSPTPGVAGSASRP